MAMTTILIPALTGLSKESNPNESILITPEQSTWLGKMQYLVYVQEKISLTIMEFLQLLLDIYSCQLDH